MHVDSTNTVTVAQPRISFWENWWNLILVIALIVALQSRVFWYLDFVQVFSSILWTGTDLFMGFILGPIMRRLDFPVRRAVIMRLMPRMLFYMPVVSTVSITSGYYLAKMLGLFGLPYPQMYWLIGALIVAGILILQGVGMLLPTNLMVFFEMRKPQPDPEKIKRLMGFYIKVVASQALMQIAIVIIMARFRSGV